MEGILIACFTVIGVVIGSFLNVCIDRLPNKESLITPPSHCPACQKRLTVKDLFPIFSYLVLRGRCRYCREPIPRRVLGVEIGIGVLFAILYWYFGFSPELGIYAFYCCLFILILIIDIEHGLILNKVVFPGMIVALCISIFLAGDINIFLLGDALVLFPPGIASAGIGAAIGLGIGLIIVFLSRGGMGLGDVKMAALIGLVVGYPMVFFTLIMAAIFGGIAALFVLATRKKRRKETLPFGPALSISAILTLLCGMNILSWYLGVIN